MRFGEDDPEYGFGQRFIDVRDRALFLQKTQ